MGAGTFKKSLTLAAALALLVGCAASLEPRASTRDYLSQFRDGLYDNNTFLVNPMAMRLEYISKAMQTVVTESEFRTTEGEIVKQKNEGIATVLGNRYLLTVDHVVSSYELSVPTPLGKLVRPAEKLKETTYLRHGDRLIPLKSLVRERETDVALFLLPEGINLPSFPYAMGNSDELQMGNYVYIVGNPLNYGLNVREGIVSTMQAPPAIREVDADEKNAFMVSNGLNPGDSGGPVIAIRDGKFELVGLAQGTFANTQKMSWVIRINSILNRLAKKLQESNETRFVLNLIKGMPAPHP